MNFTIEISDTMTELKRARDELFSAVESFPADKRPDVLFDKWSLKEILSHINGWNLLRIMELNLLLQNKPIDKIADFDACNLMFVKERTGKSWDYVYSELITSSNALVGAYSKLPEKVFTSKIWNDSRKTVLDWLRIDLDHWAEHLKEIKKYK